MMGISFFAKAAPRKPHTRPEDAATLTYNARTIPLSRKTIRFAVNAAQGAAMALAKTIREVRGSFSLPESARTRSIAMPGTM